MFVPARNDDKILSTSMSSDITQVTSRSSNHHMMTSQSSNKLMSSYSTNNNRIKDASSAKAAGYPVITSNLQVCLVLKCCLFSSKCKIFYQKNKAPTLVWLYLLYFNYFLHLIYKLQVCLVLSCFLFSKCIVTSVKYLTRNKAS